MRAAVLHARERIEIRDVDEPRLQQDDVLVELRAVGICGSDLHAFRGHHPFRQAPVVLGHEGAGRVVRAPSGSAVRDGDRIAIMPVLSCWECRRCEAGLAHLCERKRVPGRGWDGLLSEYIAAPTRVLFPLAPQISYAEAAMMEPVAVAWHAARTGNVTVGVSVAVLGAGSIGGLVACVCRLHQTDTLLVSDLREQNLKLVEQLTGCHTVNAAQEDVVAHGRALLDGDGFDVVVVASGHPTCMDEALALCRPRGTVVVLPMFGEALQTDFNSVVLNETVVKGSTIYTPADFRTAADTVNRRVLDVRGFLAEPRPLADAHAVFCELDHGADLVKAHLDPHA